MSFARRTSFTFRRKDSMSPERRSSVSNFIYLREEGEAKLVFVKTSDQFEGVFINKNEDVFALHGVLSGEKGGNVNCTLTVYDEETGSEYVINNISIVPYEPSRDQNGHVTLTNHKNDDDLENVSDLDTSSDGSPPPLDLNHVTNAENHVTNNLDDHLTNSTCQVTSPTSHVTIDGQPICMTCPFDHRPISFQSDSVCFDTVEILMGAKADQELTRYMNPSLVGQNLCVYSGRMQISACKHVTPHKGFTARRMSKEFFEEIDAIKANDFLL